MKQMRFFSKWAVGAAMCAALAVFAADKISFESRPGSKITLDGTSTVHDWTVESQIIKGTMEVPANFAQDPAAAAKNTKVEVTIPVRSVKSGKSAMNSIMWEAMKMKEHPNIEYKLLELTPKSGGAQGNSAQFDAKGSLKVAGVTRTNTMPVTIEKVDATKAKVTGTTTVKMTDFGIKPPAPTVGLGFIKTGDDVKIAFEWQTEQAAPGAPKTAGAGQ
jgi:polyisoprenoid-binding protein YceI